MQEVRIVKVNNREVPVLISDEKEALLAAKAAGRAVVGLWSPGTDPEDLSAAGYVVEDLSAATDEYLERVARRNLGLPWKICETERLTVRELFGDDFDEIYSQNIGRGFGMVEEFLAYVKNQYAFYEFGMWALTERETGELVGAAGLFLPQDEAEDGKTPDEAGVSTGTDAPDRYELVLASEEAREESGEDAGMLLELGYHIFSPYRRMGYGLESCQAILKYGRERLGVNRFLVRIDRKNLASKRLAGKLGFVEKKACQT